MTVIVELTKQGLTKGWNLKEILLKTLAHSRILEERDERHSMFREEWEVKVKLEVKVEREWWWLGRDKGEEREDSSLLYVGQQFHF